MIKKFFKKDIIIFVIGLALVCYPIVSNFIENSSYHDLIKTYEDEVNNLDDEKKQQIINTANDWNEALYLKQQGLSVNDQNNYESILNINNGIMGSIEIPKIDVNLPIYHGTSDDILNIGTGHVEDSSMPIGGINTHTVITGHSGLPSAKLFTRLDELEEKDIFYIYVLDEVLAYEIDKIEIVLPEKADCTIEDGKDLATLVTCTPYGINTHRLMLTGHRIPYKQSVKDKIRKNLPSNHELIIYAIPLVFIVLAIIIFKKKGAKK